MKQAIGLGLLVMLAGAAPAWAQVSEVVAVTGDILPVEEMTVITDAGSAGSTSEIAFLVNDADDPGVTGPNPNFFYAPPRSQTGKNYHALKVRSNQSSFTISADVSGQAANRPLAERLNLWCGGFWRAGATTASGGESTQWERADTFQRVFNDQFDGVVPLNFQLDATGLQEGPVNGQVTYTMVAN